MKQLRPTDHVGPYHKFKVGDLIMVKDPKKLPTPLMEVQLVWGWTRTMYQVRDYDTRQVHHLVADMADSGYVRYEGST